VAHDDRQVEERDVPLRDGRDLVVELKPDRNSRLETTGEPEELVPRTHERVDDERSASRGSGCDRSDVSADLGREPVARALDDRPAQQAHTVAVPLTRPETSAWRSLIARPLTLAFAALASLGGGFSANALLNPVRLNTWFGWVLG
jgi:hypothetical protein